MGGARHEAFTGQDRTMVGGARQEAYTEQGKGREGLGEVEPKRAMVAGNQVVVELLNGSTRASTG